MDEAELMRNGAKSGWSAERIAEEIITVTLLGLFDFDLDFFLPVCTLFDVYWKEYHVFRGPSCVDWFFG